MAKSLAFDEVAAKKDQAERSVRNFLGEEDRANEIADKTVQDYAVRKHIDIVDNPGRRVNGTMANGQTKEDLLDHIADLQDENDALQAQLDAIADVLDTDDDADADDDDTE